MNISVNSQAMNIAAAMIRIRYNTGLLLIPIYKDKKSPGINRGDQKSLLFLNPI